MLAKFLGSGRPLIVLDCETTGLDAQSDRIVELALQAHRPDGAMDEWRSLVDPGIPIPPVVTRIHHITNEMMKGCRVCGRTLERHAEEDAVDEMGQRCEDFKPIPRFAQVAAKLAKGFSDCDFAGKNVRFDLEFLASEFRRAKVEWSYAGTFILDADALERLAEPRHLAALHKKYVGMEHDQAHSALSDVRATTTVLVKQLERYEAALPRSLEKLHEMSWPGWLDVAGKFSMKDGEAFVNFGKHRGRAFRDTPRDYFAWMAKSDFPADTKWIAAEAAEGRFPK